MRGRAHKGLQVTAGQLYLFGRGELIVTLGPCEYSAPESALIPLDYVGPCVSLGSSLLRSGWANTDYPSE